VPRGAVRSPLPWLGALVLVYLGVPVVAFGVRLLTTSSRGFHDPGLFPALSVSLQAACISTAVITVLGVPLAYLLARSPGRLTSVLGVVVQLPLAVPPLMGGVLLVYLVGPSTWLGRLFGGHLTSSLTGVVLAQTFVAAPFLVVSARAAFGAVDPALGDVAATLGHGELGRFLRVDVPAAAPGIRAGMVLTWLRAFGEYGATVILAYHPTSLPVYTYTQFSATGLPATMAPTALALGVAVCAVMLGRLVLVHRRRRRPPVVPAVPAVPRPALAPFPIAPFPIAFDVDHRVGAFRLAVAHRSTSVRLAILGPSGSGKSTLLRCLAGLYGPAPGPVAYGGRQVERVPVERRRVGYVAQSFGLFPHLRVWEQLLFATDADPVTAASWLTALHLDGLEDRLPGELSGGQRQRVALAQALSRSPDVLLLDEPFSALDTPVRFELRRELRRLQRVTGLSTVLVTHDPEEAALLADEVIVITGGRPLQQGAVRSVYGAPASLDVARLLGVRNVFEAVVEAPGLLVTAGTALAADTGAVAPGTAVIWSVPPGAVRLLTGAAGERDGEGGGLLLPAVVEDVADLGTGVEMVVSVAAGLVLEVRRAGATDFAAGDRCVVELPRGAVSLWAVPGEDGAPPVSPAAAPPG